MILRTDPTLWHRRALVVMRLLIRSVKALNAGGVWLVDWALILAMGFCLFVFLLLMKLVGAEFE